VRIAQGDALGSAGSSALAPPTESPAVEPEASSTAPAGVDTTDLPGAK
jgi:hypothetical protein